MLYVRVRALWLTIDESMGVSQTSVHPPGPRSATRKIIYSMTPLLHASVVVEGNRPVAHVQG